MFLCSAEVSISAGHWFLPVLRSTTSQSRGFLYLEKSRTACGHGSRLKPVCVARRNWSGPGYEDAAAAPVGMGRTQEEAGHVSGPRDRSPPAVGEDPAPGPIIRQEVLPTRNNSAMRWRRHEHTRHHHFGRCKYLANKGEGACLTY